MFQSYLLIHPISLPDFRIFIIFFKIMTCVQNVCHLAPEKYSSYGSPDQSGMFSGCLNARRAVNRQPGYRAGTRRADTQMFKVHTLIHSIYFPDFQIFIKISHFQIFMKKCQHIFENKMKCIFEFDQCIWKLLLLYVTLVSIEYLDSFNILSGFPDFHQNFAFSDYEKMSIYFWKPKWNAFSDLITAFESSCCRL